MPGLGRKVSTMPKDSLVQSEDFKEAVSKVKACAAAAEYINESGAPKIRYTPELMDMLSNQLFEAANYFDRIISEAEQG